MHSGFRVGRFACLDAKYFKPDAGSLECFSTSSVLSMTMKPPFLIGWLMCLSASLLVSCVAPHETVSDFQFQSSALPGSARIQITGAASPDGDHGVFLLVTMKNEGPTRLVMS